MVFLPEVFHFSEDQTVPIEENMEPGASTVFPVYLQFLSMDPLNLHLNLRWVRRKITRETLVSTSNLNVSFPGDHHLVQPQSKPLLVVCITAFV